MEERIHEVQPSRTDLEHWDSQAAAKGQASWKVRIDGTVYTVQTGSLYRYPGDCSTPGQVFTHDGTVYTVLYDWGGMTSLAGVCL